MRMCRLLITTIICIFLFCIVSYATSIEELKEIAGYKDNENIASSSYILKEAPEIEEAILSDLIKEMRPFLKDVLNKNVDDDYNFSAKEIIGIIAKHPIKFLSALYNYTVYNIKEVFDIASENAKVGIN